MRQLFRDRNARWYITGQGFSLLGDTSLWLALAIWVKELTGSSGDAGLTFFFFSISSLLSPIAGMVVDRVRRKPLLLWTNLLAGGLVLGLFAVHGRAQVWVIYAVMFGYGLATTFLSSAQSALLKTMLPEELLGDANGALRTVREGLRLVAPLVGAGLFAVVGGHVIAVIDSVTFLVAAASLLVVHVDEPRRLRRGGAAAHVLEHELEHDVETWWVEMTAGARHIWRTTVLRQIVTGCAIALLVIGFFESLIFAIVSQGLHKAPTFLGVLLALQGVGALIGGPSAAPLMRRMGPGPLVAVGLGVMALASAVLIPPLLATALVGISLFGISLPWVIVGIYTTLQVRTPNDLQGRVYSAADTVLSVPQTFSIAFGAVLVSVVNYKILLAVVVAVLLVSVAYLGTRPEQRERPDRTGATGPDAGIGATKMTAPEAA